MKNKYEYFKLQLWHPLKKFLFISLKGKWKDTYYYPDSRKVIIFSNYFEAKNARNVMFSDFGKENNNWFVADN